MAATNKSTLITASQVVRRGPIESDFPLARITPHIYTAEFRWLADEDFGLLGKPFYDALIADRRSFIQYDSTVAYIAGQTVIFNGTLYEANIGSTGVVPPDATFWDEVSYFMTPAYQTLWDEHLEELIAMAVVHSSIYANTFQITASGPTQKVSGDNKPASTEGVRLLKDSIKSDIDLLAKRMHQYLMTDNVAFALYNGHQENNCCDEPNNPNRSNPFGVYIAKDDRSC